MSGYYGTVAPDLDQAEAGIDAGGGILPSAGRRPSRRRVSDHPRTRESRESWLIFGVSLVVYSALGWYGAYVLEIYNYDGLARIAQAQGVLFSRDPHLGALGFVWAPLPALTDIPLIVLLKPLGLPLLSGPIMSALYSALALAMLSSILKKFGLGKAWRLAWVGAFGVQKLIMHNATMGLSEAGFLAFLLLSLNGYMSWEKERKVGGLIMAGVGSALAIYCRYEGLAWVAVITVAIIWRLCLSGFKPWEKIVEGTLLAFAVPIGWALPLWMVMNWQIQGNPLYFLVGAGATSNTPDTAKAVGATHPFFYAYGSLSGSLSLMLREVAGLAPLLLVASALLVLCVFWRRRWADLVYLAFAWSILGFTFMIALGGILPPWTRYFFWAVPGGMIAAGAAYHASSNTWLRRSIALGVLAFSLYSASAMYADAWTKLPQQPDQKLVSALLVAPESAVYTRTGVQLEEYKEIASYLNGEPAGVSTLVDSSIASPLVFFLSHPNHLVQTTDRDFFSILRDPAGQVDQILVPYPSFDARGRSEVLNLYPDIYDQGEAWATLVHEFQGPEHWRLYRLEPPQH